MAMFEVFHTINLLYISPSLISIYSYMSFCRIYLVDFLLFLRKIMFWSIHTWNQFHISRIICWLAVRKVSHYHKILNHSNSWNENYGRWIWVMFNCIQCKKNSRVLYIISIGFKSQFYSAAYIVPYILYSAC